MHGNDLHIGSYVVINAGCPLEISIENPNQVEVTCGRRPSDVFDFVIDREALRRFVELGSNALAEMDCKESQ